MPIKLPSTGHLNEHPTPKHRDCILFQTIPSIGIGGENGFRLTKSKEQFYENSYFPECA